MKSFCEHHTNNIIIYYFIPLNFRRGKYFTYDDDIDETEDMMSRVVNGSTEIFEGAFTYEDIRAILKKMQKSPMFKHLDALQEPSRCSFKIDSSCSSDR